MKFIIFWDILSWFIQKNNSFYDPNIIRIQIKVAGIGLRPMAYDIIECMHQAVL
jgi:hypothetical protein